MNKVAINLLCILILTFLGATILIPAGEMGYYIFQIYDHGHSSEENADDDQSRMSVGPSIYAVPSSFGVDASPLRDSVRFDDGRTYPVTITSLKIHPGENGPYSFNMVLGSALTVLAILVCYIIMAIKLVKFVIHINRGEIFSLRNIRLLTRIGIFLLVIALLETLLGVLDYSVLSSMDLRLEGVSFETNWSFPYSDCIIGLLALLMAGIWRRGLHLKEEQELTI